MGLIVLRVRPTPTFVMARLITHFCSVDVKTTALKESMFHIKRLLSSIVDIRVKLVDETLH